VHVLWVLLWRDFYTPVWPNIAADALAAGWVVRRVKIHLSRHRAWQNKHFQAIHTTLKAQDERAK
jgi:hypothetical protein